jgi:YnbE-like lipoprotein
MNPVNLGNSATSSASKRSVIKGVVLAVLVGLSAACTPTVKVATDEPITINLNVNIKHEILVKVDKELDNLFDEDSELF